MKRLALTFLCMLTFTIIYSQTNVDSIRREAELLLQNQPVKKFDYSMQTGSMFYAGSVKGSTFYIAPEFTYNFSPKLKFQGGVMLMNNNYNFSGSNFLMNEGDNRLFSQPSKYQAVVYGKGDYKLNDKLTFTGSFIKNFNDQSNNSLQNRAWNNSFQMMSMGLNYKITPNLTLGAGVRFMQSNGYYNNPMMYNLSPVNSDLFSDY